MVILATYSPFIYSTIFIGTPLPHLHHEPDTVPDSFQCVHIYCEIIISHYFSATTGGKYLYYFHFMDAENVAQKGDTPQSPRTSAFSEVISSHMTLPKLTF